MQIFPAREPLVSGGVEIFGTPSQSNSGRRLLLVINTCFEKLTQAITLYEIVEYTVEAAREEKLMFKCGAPETVLTGNGSHFSS